LNQGVCTGDFVGAEALLNHLRHQFFFGFIGLAIVPITAVAVESAFCFVTYLMACVALFETDLTTAHVIVLGKVACDAPIISLVLIVVAWFSTPTI